MLSLYIHIPFCEVKCGYCDFFSVARGYEDFDLQEAYVEALLREIRERAPEFAGRPIRSIFFGGGTPSLLDPRLIEKILKELRVHFTWGPEVETTLETNPKTVSETKLKDFRSLGINRLSIGVQSFQDRFLKSLGRIHSGEEAIRTVADARRAGFENINCDLIFALPQQTFEDWESDLRRAIALGTPHISAYHLTIETATPFAALHQKGQLALPEEDVGVRMLTWTRETLAAAGLDAYEISNFSKPGSECRHNQNYWRYGEYLGLGAGAAGCVRVSGREDVFAVRRHNIKNLKRYLEGDFLDFDDKLDRRTAMAEYAMLGIRTREGIDLKNFEKIFGETFEKVFGGPIQKALNGKQVVWDNERLRLSRAGLLWADGVAEGFLI